MSYKFNGKEILVKQNIVRYVLQIWVFCILFSLVLNSNYSCSFMIIIIMIFIIDCTSNNSSTRSDNCVIGIIVIISFMHSYSCLMFDSLVILLHSDKYYLKIIHKISDLSTIPLTSVILFPVIRACCLWSSVECHPATPCWPVGGWHQSHPQEHFHLWCHYSWSAG